MRLKWVYSALTAIGIANFAALPRWDAIFRAFSPLRYESSRVSSKTLNWRDTPTFFSTSATLTEVAPSGRFFSNYIYGPVPGAYDPEADEYDEECMSDGIGGTTIQGKLAYQVCDHFTIGAVLAFTSTLSGEARDAIEYMGRGGSFKDLVWGGLQAKLDF